MSGTPSPISLPVVLTVLHRAKELGMSSDERDRAMRLIALDIRSRDPKTLEDHAGALLDPRATMTYNLGRYTLAARPRGGEQIAYSLSAQERDETSP